MLKVRTTGDDEFCFKDGDCEDKFISKIMGCRITCVDIDGHMSASETNVFDWIKVRMLYPQKLTFIPFDE